MNYSTVEQQQVIEWIPCGYNWTGHYLGEQTSSLHDTAPLLAGYLSCAVAAFLYGCNFVPLKLVKTGDGIFCQWIVCASAWLVGLLVQLFRGDPQFYSLSVLGGTVWALGNCCAIPVINLIGLSVGVMLWNCTSILVGWASSRYGLLFDMCPQVPNSELLNYAGVGLCLLAVITFAFVRVDQSSLADCCMPLRTCLDPEVPEVATSSSVVASSPMKSPKSTTYEDEDVDSLEEPVKLVNGHSINKAGDRKSLRRSSGESDVFLGEMSEGWRRIIGVSLALLSGICYGLAFVPWNYVREHAVLKGYRASRSGLDYVFTQFCGIFLTSSLIFFTYVVFHKKPNICSKLIIPSFISGIMWGIATVALFVANEILSVAITFPIIGAFPGIVASIFGIFLFHEISGIRSFVILGLASAFTIVGVALTGWSKHYQHS